MGFLAIISPSAPCPPPPPPVHVLHTLAAQLIKLSGISSKLASFQTIPISTRRLHVFALSFSVIVYSHLSVMGICTRFRRTFSTSSTPGRWRAPLLRQFYGFVSERCERIVFVFAFVYLSFYQIGLFPFAVLSLFFSFFFIAAFMCISVLSIWVFLPLPLAVAAAVVDIVVQCRSLDEQFVGCFCCCGVCRNVADFSTIIPLLVWYMRGWRVCASRLKKSISHICFVCTPALSLSLPLSVQILLEFRKLRIHTCVMALKYSVICSSHHLIRFRFSPQVYVSHRRFALKSRVSVVPLTK